MTKGRKAGHRYWAWFAFCSGFNGCYDTFCVSFGSSSSSRSRFLSCTLGNRNALALARLWRGSRPLSFQSFRELSDLLCFDILHHPLLCRAQSSSRLLISSVPRLSLLSFDLPRRLSSVPQVPNRLLCYSASRFQSFSNSCNHISTLNDPHSSISYSAS